MLTRLRVSGFKNLVDVDVRFGPFTCIAGVNGVGKSNLFDAIRFLSLLADQPLLDAALSVRDEGNRSGDVQGLFYRSGAEPNEQMSFVAEMIIPKTGVDDLGQTAEASITFLQYTLVLAYRKDSKARAQPGSLEIIKEDLSYINIGDAATYLRFPHSLSWRQSAIKGRRTSPFISTTSERLIKLHQDGISGRPREYLAATLPRTTLSAVNATENPTALLARREMQTWRLLQLEPSALRRPDPFTAPTQLGTDGSHLPATLYRLAREHAYKESTPEGQTRAEKQIYAQVTNRLAELIEDVHDVWIDRDERRELLTLYVASRDQTPHRALSLSDGTLRFLALATLELDPTFQGMLCLEEPENGIHPLRIPAILALLQDIATDPTRPIGEDNPLRQVIINTHAPIVVQQVKDESLLLAMTRETLHQGKICQSAFFLPLSDTWRTKAKNEKDSSVIPVARGEMLAYLNPVLKDRDSDENGYSVNGPQKQRKPYSPRVIDRPDMQPLLPFPEPV